MTTRPPKTNSVAYQIRIVLRDSDPAIWRQIMVRGDMTLRGLHQALQIVMGWTESHRHEFRFKRNRYGRPARNGVTAAAGRTSDDSKVRLKQLMTDTGQCLIYEYDRNDDWEHFLTVQKVLPLEKGQAPIRCLSGARACPPEGVGGISGYEAFLHALDHRNHSEHKNILKWVGGAFDPEAFDLDRVNRRLRSAQHGPRRRAAKRLTPIEKIGTINRDGKETNIMIKKTNAFMKPLTPSTDLAKVVGSKPLPRTEVVKKLWAYIKKNKLQDTKNKRNINADANLKVIFHKNTVNMFEMTKLVSKHLN